MATSTTKATTTVKTNGKIAFKKDGVTILRPSTAEPELVKNGWKKVK